MDAQWDRSLSWIISLKTKVYRQLWIGNHVPTFFCSSSPLTSWSGISCFDSWLGLLSRAISCSDPKRLCPSRERPRNFSLALKKSMRSERPTCCTVALGCWWWSSSLVWPRPAQFSSVAGTCWLNFCLSSGTCVSGPAERFGLCLFGSGVLLLPDPDLGLSSGWSGLSGLASVAERALGDVARWWRAAGGCGRPSETVSAKFIEVTSGRISGTTVAALGLIRSGGSSAMRLSSESPRPFEMSAAFALGSGFSCSPATLEGPSVCSSSWSDGEAWLPHWFRGLERPSDCAPGVLSNGS